MLVNDKNKRSLASATIVALSSSMIATTAVSANDIMAEVAALNTMPIQNTRASVNGAKADISALRYYAVRGEQDRVQSEINRLKLLYPNWQQPENIFAEEGSNDSALWKLYGQGKIDEVKEEIARLQKLDESYSPSVELIDKLHQREQRTGIADAWTRKDWEDVIAQADNNPALLASGDIELIWFLAEAYARKERPEDSFEAYLAALKSAKSDHERKATVQKAGLLLSSDKALVLLDNTPELKHDPKVLEEVRDAIVRGALARSAELGEELPQALETQIESFIVRTRMNNSHEDAILLAWSKFGQRDWKAAQEWFDRALTQRQSPKAIEGAIMSAMRLGDQQKAAQLAGEWVDISPEIGALFISVHAPALLQEKPPAMSSQFLQIFAQKTAELNNGEGAEALGWYAFNVRQFDAADAWFSKAMAWEETETAVYGKILTAGRQKDRTLFDTIKAGFGAKYPKIAALKYTFETRNRRIVKVKRTSTKTSRAGALRAKIAKLHTARRYTQCLQHTRTLRQYGPLRAGDHQMRGWCLLGAKRPSEAEQAFAAAVRLGGKGRVSSAYGQALAALRSGKTNQALDIANNNRLTRKQRRTVDIELLTQRARAAFGNRDYAASVHALDRRAKLTPETRDLTLMRGWAHYHSGRITSARAIFANLDQQLSTRDSQKGLHATRRTLTKAASNDK